VTDAQARWAFPRRASSAAEARKVTRSFLAALRARATDRSGGGGVDEEAAVLAVSELVSNAILHAAVPGDIELRLEARRGTLHIEVEDCDPRPPVMAPDTSGRDRGRGLLIVERLATRWGWAPVPDNGKAVWCELADVSR
jgi:anti-sigma regulatory factor (Ser/Thr protein kinase)